MNELWKWFVTDATVAQVVAWVVGAVVVAVAIWRGWPVFRQVIKTLAHLVQVADLLATLDTRLAGIEYELRPNGGGSIHDKVTRTEQAVADVSARLELTDQNVEAVRKQNRSLKASVYNTNRKLARLTPPDIATGPTTTKRRTA